LICGWCRLELATTNPKAVFCSRKCRQSAWRLKKLGVTRALNDTPGRFAYADPPYPGLSSKYYRHEPSFAGEIDHAKLISSLTAGNYTGWALSTSAKALRDVLSLCPRGARVCAWVKPIGASPNTYGLHNCWEPLIVVAGRQERPGRRDWLSAQPARNGGTLMGRKPIAFCSFLFQALGMSAGDDLDDLFPGTGIVGRAWSAYCRPAPASVLQERQLSPAPGQQ
jgi:hypothetical protein